MNERGQTWAWGIAALLAIIAYALSMLHAEAVTEERLKSMASVTWGGAKGPAAGRTPSM